MVRPQIGLSTLGEMRSLRIYVRSHSRRQSIRGAILACSGLSASYRGCVYRLPIGVDSIEGVLDVLSQCRQVRDAAIALPIESLRDVVQLARHAIYQTESKTPRCGTPAAIPLRHALKRVFLATR